MVACLCHFVISFFRLFDWRYGAAPRRNNAKRKDEITKKRQAKERKDKITPGEKTKKRNAPSEMTNNEREKTKNAMRNNAILKSYFSSFRMASFRHFVFSPGVISYFRYFAWRFFVISSLRLALFRLFTPQERQAKRRKDEKTPREKTKYYVGKMKKFNVLHVTDTYWGLCCWCPIL